MAAAACCDEQAKRIASETENTFKIFIQPITQEDL